jgi:hypothetical protein
MNPMMTILGVLSEKRRQRILAEDVLESATKSMRDIRIGGG